MIPNTTTFLITFLSVFFTACDNSQQDQSVPKANNVFAILPYDKAVAYSYDGEGDIEIIDEKGELAKKIKKKVVLSKPQTIRLTNIFCDESTYGGDIASCFNPHFGIVFYKTGKPIAYVSVCLECNYLVSSIKIPNDEGGFSDEGVKNIVDFEKELNF
jgi:hypothetical protein